MPKGIYLRTKRVWNKGLKLGYSVWNKGKGILNNDDAINLSKWLFYSNISTKECDKIFIKKFNVRVHINKIWGNIFTQEQRKEHRKIVCSKSKLGDLNPMKQQSAKNKSSISHKNQISWNKGLNKEEMLVISPNMKFGGGRPKGYKHSINSRIKMSQNTKGKKHNVIFTKERKLKCSERMIRNRQDFEFNQKMFKSLCNITRPHKKVIGWIKEYTNLNTISNYPIYIGNKYAEIDEADISKKIAIFVDGNYWHNYPNLRQWDKCVNTCLINKGWKVLRFWESDIKNNSEVIINDLKSVGGNAIPFINIPTIIIQGNETTSS